MQANDFNLIKALISQAYSGELQQVADIVQAEIASNIKQTQGMTRAVPRIPNAGTLGADLADKMVKAGIGQVDPDALRQYSVRDIEATENLQKLHVSESGATSSHVPLRYDLIPRSLIERAAQRYTEGAKIHGERGYQKGLLDRNFIINRINHITEHWNKLWHPDYSKADSPACEEGIEHKSINDNLGAIIWGVAFICEVMDTKTGFELLRELRSDGRVKITPD